MSSISRPAGESRRTRVSSSVISSRVTGFRSTLCGKRATCVSRLIWTIPHTGHCCAPASVATAKSSYAGHLPGRSPWLYAQIHGHPDRQDEILIDPVGHSRCRADQAEAGRSRSPNLASKSLTWVVLA